MRQLSSTRWPIEIHSAILVAPKSVYTESTPQVDQAFCAHIGRLAVRSLYSELVLYPKPGLVSLVDCGSHHDMTAVTFLRSLFSLRHYFVDITAAGMRHAPFSVLRQLGIEAETRMLAATGGINTHRGAIFSVGMLCAAIGHCRARHIALSAPAIRTALLSQWGDALVRHMQPAAANAPLSHGLQVAVSHAVGGAREEAALGLPSVFEIALPALEQTLAAGRGTVCAQIDAFFALMAHVSDTNVVHRGGAAGAAMVRNLAQQFLALGGSAHPDWERHARDCHQAFVRQRLSPGGAADLLAATCLVHAAISSYRGHDAGFWRTL